MKQNSAIKKIMSATLKKWSGEVAGIVLFGSFAMGREYRDVDVLIVLEKLHKGRVERIKDIADIKRALDFPADILLVSKEECMENFRSHNPLFLDIASEGKIIHDKGFLKNLIDETKLEIKRNKIKKEVSGWIFPVKGRAPTPLSEITNKDWANYWLEDSKRDLKAAEYLLREKLYERSVYHCQQSVEKVVKAVLMCFGVYEKTHYVANILRKELKKKDLEEYVEELDVVIAIAEALEPHVSLSRYPRLSGSSVWLPAKEYTRGMAEKALKDAKKALKTGKGFVKWWFQTK